MELAIPLLALGSLYLVANQNKSSPAAAASNSDLANGAGEAFHTMNDELPNTDLRDANFAVDGQVINAETQLTSELSTVNKYDTPYAYTDKYFNPNFGLMAAQKENSRKTFTAMTGDTVSSDYFQHNNMVPFFGSNVRTRLLDENSNEGLMDSMTGAGSQTINKREQSPLFSPNNHLNWVYGMPSATDFIQSRMNVSNKMSNVKPFEEIRVRPGMGESGDSLGFNSGMMAREMWMPKTADQLRVASKPKASGFAMGGREGPAVSMIKERGLQGALEKNRPDRIAQLDETRYFSTVGAGGQSATLHGVPVDRPEEHRTTATMSYIGAAGRDGADAMYVEGEYMPSHRNQLGEVPLAPADAVGHSGAYDVDYGVKSMKSYRNNRNTTNTDGYLGIFSGAMGAAVAPLMDVLRPSKRQNTVGALRPYQNPESTVKSSYIFNPADRPAPTIREMTEQSKGHLFMSESKGRNGYLSTGWNITNTNRQDTGDFYYSGVAGTSLAKEVRPYDAEYQQRNNDIKSSTIAGRTPNGNMGLLNSDMNVRSNRFLESDLNMAASNRRMASMPYQTPDASKMGRMTGAQPLYEGSQLDRMDSSVLSALNSNPYYIRNINHQ